VRDSAWNDTYSIDIENMPRWMKLSNDNRTITVDYKLLREDNHPLYFYNITLCD
jgi:hypothetical protein